MKLIEHLPPTVLRTLCRRDEPAEYLAAVDKRLAKGEKLTAMDLQDIAAELQRRRR
jgi:hypothetical protein